MWHQLELAPQLESDLQDTVDWGKMRLGDFKAGKAQLSFISGHNLFLSLCDCMQGGIILPR